MSLFSFYFRSCFWIVKLLSLCPHPCPKRTPRSPHCLQPTATFVRSWITHHKKKAHMGSSHHWNVQQILANDQKAWKLIKTKEKSIAVAHFCCSISSKQPCAGWVGHRHGENRLIFLQFFPWVSSLYHKEKLMRWKPPPGLPQLWKAAVGFFQGELFTKLGAGP